VMRPILLAAASVNHSAPSGPAVMPAGLLFAVGIVNSVMACAVAGHGLSSEAAFGSLLNWRGQNTARRYAKAKRSKMIVQVLSSFSRLEFPPTGRDVLYQYVKPYSRSLRTLPKKREMKEAAN
jgi:hypothetical protein